MLRFQTSPDAVMTAILATALENRANSLEKRYVHGTIETHPNDWRNGCPLLRLSFTLEQAIAQQRLLREALLEPTVYMPTDMQFLVLLDALSALIAPYNTGRRRPIVCPELGLGPYLLDHIDFNAIVDLFFWNLDFIANIASANPAIPYLQDTFHISGSAIRAASGQPALPEDLQLTICKGDDIVSPDQATSYYRRIAPGRTRSRKKLLARSVGK